MKPMSEDRSLQITSPDLAMSRAVHATRLETKMTNIEAHPEWELLARLPMRLRAGVILPRFKLKDLTSLTVGAIVESTWGSEADVPIKCGAIQLAWAEFEVMEHRLAVRITRLA